MSKMMIAMTCAHLVLLGHLGLLVLQVSRDLQDPLESREIRASRVLQDLQAYVPVPAKVY
jgi:hypothetical protein